ncbi:MAG: hypothetical protein DCF20_00865 [Pseudanabaena sp.]|nr:MAG: hypothetical protein DCF20_00865 [Pseudanabaena sp.]
MLATAPLAKPSLPEIAWERLPDDFILPDEPVENNLQPLLAAALRESLELAGLILESMLIASNFGICATVGNKTVVKAPDWVYIPEVKPLLEGEVRRSYTPKIEGDLPLIALEFVSEAEGGEYSINPHYPYGKWYFYERILQIPLYGIFHPKSGELDLYRLVEGKYELQSPDENMRFWIAEMNLFLGIWAGKKAEFSASWLRWWDKSGSLLLWGSEMVERERQLIEQERQRTEQERQRAEDAESRLQHEQVIRQRLMDRLKALGIDTHLDDE